MPSTSLPRVAYFCMEYALQSDFKMYAGGLGILAGDYLKGARDHKFPIVGIGIKWKQGYTDQRITPEGKGIDTYPIYHLSVFKRYGSHRFRNHTQARSEMQSLAVR